VSTAKPHQAARDKEAARDGMLAHLKANLAPEVWRKLSPTVLKEVLSHLADWYYSERSLANPSTNQADPAFQALQKHHGAEVKAALKTNENASFLDALDEIR